MGRRILRENTGREEWMTERFLQGGSEMLNIIMKTQPAWRALEVIEKVWECDRRGVRASKCSNK